MPQTSSHTVKTYTGRADVHLAAANLPHRATVLVAEGLSAMNRAIMILDVDYQAASQEHVLGLLS